MAISTTQLSGQLDDGRRQEGEMVVRCRVLSRTALTSLLMLGISDELTQQSAEQGRKEKEEA